MDFYQWLDCNKGFVVIPGAEQRSFSPDSTGDYAVEVIKQTCRDTSACFSFILTSQSKVNNFQALSIYPNPTDDQITIELGQSGFTRIWVMTADGRKVAQYQTRSQRYSFSLPRPKGIYMIQVLTQERWKVFRIEKK